MVLDALDQGPGLSDIEIPTELTDFNHNDRLNFVYCDFGEIERIIPEGRIGTYHPYFVYPVRDTIKIDNQLTKAYNEKHYVYATSSHGEEIRVFYPNNGGKPRVWKGRK
jgi:hypothetical protein